MIPAGISIALGGNLSVFILFLILFIASAIFFYRYTLPPLPYFRRMLFTSLRSLALSLLLFVFFEPVLRLINHEEQQPLIAVLVDNSQSMNIKDRSGNRKEVIERIVKRNEIGENIKDAGVEYFAFSSHLQPVKPKKSDSISFTGETTDLSAVLAEMKGELLRKNIQAAVLITDGNYTVGKNPVYAAQELAIPIYTVGVGDTDEQKDIGVRKIITNNLAYAETRVPVDVTVKSSGYDGENVEVTVSEGSALIDRKMIKLLDGTREYQVRLTVEPKEEGVKKYIVSVSKLPGELTDRNNSQSIFIKVLKNKLRIVIIAGAPSPDVTAVRNALVDDRHFDVSEFVQKNASEFYDHSLTRGILDTSDCLVFVGFPNSFSDQQAISFIRESIERQKKPVLFINNKLTDYTKLKKFESILPFYWSNVNEGEVLVLPSVVERERRHPLILLDGTFASEEWQQLPPIFKTQTVFQAKPEADVLVQVKLQNVVLAEPLVAIRDINRQKVVAITGYGVWRWQLLALGNSKTEKFLPQYINKAVRWLTTKENNKNVRVDPVKESFTTAEPVEFTGEVYDEQLKPVDAAELAVEIQHGSEKFQIILAPVGAGRYEGAVDAAGEGEYTFIAIAKTDGRILGEDKGRFSVGRMNVEFIETRMNKPLMEQIAYRTGGKYYNAQELTMLASDVAANVKFASKEIIHTSEIELWNWKYIAAAVILLLAVEWFLRKRSGML